MPQLYSLITIEISFRTMLTKQINVLHSICNFGTTLANKITSDQDFKSYLSKPVVNSMSISHTGRFEIIGFVDKMKPNGRCGFDSITPLLLKNDFALLLKY